MDLSKFKDLYITEAEDHLQKLNDNLLKVEKQPGNQKLLDELMRSAHSLKGSSATMGYQKMAFLTHVLEDVFDYARSDVLELNKKIINELFKAFDALERAVKKIKKDGKETNLTATTNKIKKITGVETEGVGKSKRTASGKPVFTKGSNSKKSKDSKENKKSEKKGGATELEEEEVREAVESAEVSHIKVPVERLDKLMGLMEELLIDKMKLQILQRANPEIREVVEHLNRLVSDIQYQVMQSRLVPVEQIFARFPRMVRDLSQKEKKQIEFEISSGGLELDRTIIDGLAQPLVHLLRNAIDHGISQKGTIDLLARREKDYALIMVTNRGESINWESVIQSAIDRKIVTAAEGQKLFARLKENPIFVDRDIKNLLFNPRLSTKKKVTETSGRGVGLSVVKKFTNQLGGRVIVQSPLVNTRSQDKEKIATSDGASFTMELPLSLAIIKALLVKADGSQFAIPFSSIERTVRIPRDKIKSLGDQDVAIVDGREVPLARLHNIFRLVDKMATQKTVTEKEAEPAPYKSHDLAVLVRRGQDTAGVVVDDLLGEEEITVKPLPSILRRAKGFSGSTILGDGRTILILDTVGLLEDTRKLLRM